jgi:transcriptional regulator with XRE-family HTH domain
VAIGELHRRVALNLRQYRADHGLSQEKLGEITGQHRTSIGKIERAEKDIRLSTLEQLAERLGLDPVDLQRPVTKVGTAPAP